MLYFHYQEFASSPFLLHDAALAVIASQHISTHNCSSSIIGSGCDDLFPVPLNVEPLIHDLQGNHAKLGPLGVITCVNKLGGSAIVGPPSSEMAAAGALVAVHLGIIL